MNIFYGEKTGKIEARPQNRRFVTLLGNMRPPRIGRDQDQAYLSKFNCPKSSYPSRVVRFMLTLVYIFGNFQNFIQQYRCVVAVVVTEYTRYAALLFGILNYSNVT